MDPTIVDLVTLALLIFLGGKGLIKGFVQEIFTLGALVVAFLGAYFLYHPISHLINQQMGSESPWTAVVTFVILFIGINLIVRIIGEKLEVLLEKLRLSTANRLIGLGIGCIKALLIMFVLTLLLVHYPISPELSAYIETSITFHIANATPLISNLFEQYISSNIDGFLQNPSLPNLPSTPSQISN